MNIPRVAGCISRSSAHKNIEKKRDPTTPAPAVLEMIPAVDRKDTIITHPLHTPRRITPRVTPPARARDVILSCHLRPACFLCNLICPRRERVAFWWSSNARSKFKRYKKNGVGDSLALLNGIAA
ncbi:unnamed protein product, partial [Ectocarpus sp. 12 AP-2014]